MNPLSLAVVPFNVYSIVSYPKKLGSGVYVNNESPKIEIFPWFDESRMVKTTLAIFKIRSLSFKWTDADESSWTNNVSDSITICSTGELNGFSNAPKSGLEPDGIGLIFPWISKSGTMLVSKPMPIQGLQSANW